MKSSVTLTPNLRLYTSTFSPRCGKTEVSRQQGNAGENVFPWSRATWKNDGPRDASSRRARIQAVDSHLSPREFSSACRSANRALDLVYSPYTITFIFQQSLSWYNTIRLRILKVFAADCRARRRPSLFAWTRREYGLQGSPFSCSSLVFQRRRKAPLEGGDSRKTRRVAKRFCDETSRKNYRLRGNARICRGVSVKCNGSAEYAFDILWNYGRSCWESENYTFVAETSASLLGY